MILYRKIIIFSDITFNYVGSRRREGANKVPKVYQKNEIVNGQPKATKRRRVCKTY